MSADNTLGIASGLSINPTPQPFQNYFGSVEPYDYYRFNPGGYSSFTPPIPPISSSTSLYTYTYVYSNGDSYAGFTYDRSGKYIPGSYYDYSSANNETGYDGQYYISGAYSGYDSYSADQGLIYVTSYYDGDSSQTTTTPSSSYSGYSYYGANGLGSEYGYLTSTDSMTNDLFGADYYEADISGTSLYTYTYVYGNGDSYSGYTYDTTGKYTAGSYYDYSSANNEAGYNGQYYISGAYSGYDSYSAYKSLVYVTSYYDGESSQTTTPSSWYSGSSYYGVNGLGSEYGYLTSTNSITDDLFGGDYYEADIDWFSQNVRDSSLQSTARSYFTDAKLDRNDMISIFRNAEDGGLVDSTELTDLRTLVSNSSYLGMSDDVKILSNKVVNSDTANQRYQSASLGNLYAGSSDTQLEKLIDKWFLGSDRPTTSYTYQYASGSLFQNGISYEDVKQGSVGDCYFLAGLAETAYRSSSTIESMFIDNGDNTYTVRFYNNGVADYVTVDRYLPTNFSGSSVYANYGGSYSNSANELWVALAEKAYAQVNESGWISQDNTNSYDGISGGYTQNAFKNITGRSASWGYLDATSIVNAFNSGKLVSLATDSNVVDPQIVSGHSYAVIGYNSSTQKFTLFNPWGINNGTSKPGTIELSWNEIMTNFSYWEYTTT